MDDVITLVINLERSRERLAQIGHALNLQGLTWERLPAVDGRSLSPDQVNEFLNRAEFGRQHGMTPLPGELGCYLSHVAAFRRLLASPCRFGLILEDDVKPEAALAHVVGRLTLEAADRWDMVKLSSVHSGTPVPVLPLGEGHQLAVMLSRCTGSSAYLVNRKAAERYLQGLLPMSLPYDHEYDKAWKYDIKVRRVVPDLAQHDAGAVSTIAADKSASPRKFHWTRRLSTHRYRLGNELRRLSHGLMEVVRERL